MTAEFYREYLKIRTRKRKVSSCFSICFWSYPCFCLFFTSVVKKKPTVSFLLPSAFDFSPKVENVTAGCNSAANFSVAQDYPEKGQAIIRLVVRCTSISQSNWLECSVLGSVAWFELLMKMSSACMVILFGSSTATVCDEPQQVPCLPGKLCRLYFEVALFWGVSIDGHQPRSVWNQNFLCWAEQMTWVCVWSIWPVLE